MNDQLIFFLRVCDKYLFTARVDESCVTDLAAAFCIKRCSIEDKLKQFLVLLFHPPVLSDSDRGLEIIISNEPGLFIIANQYPVASLFGGISLRPVLLFFHLNLEPWLIN